jgi:predicted MPP superfamily phosphohydrolase
LPFLPIDRRKFIRLAAAASVTALAADSAILEPNRPRVVRREIALARWPSRLDGFTVALLSDFHYDPYFSAHPLHSAIGMVNDLRPDLIALTGDFVSTPLLHSNDRKAALAAEPCAALIGKMNARHGLWAVMGNHDYFTDQDHVIAALQAQGIQVLSNRSVPIDGNGARLWLGGLNDVLSRTADIRATLQPVATGDATVLLVHEPDYAARVAAFPVDLQLSGHSHGGQVRIPFVPPVFLPELGRKYIWGQYRIGQLTLYTNPGLGTVNLPIRLNCPPEITFLTLRQQASTSNTDNFQPESND